MRSSWPSSSRRCKGVPEFITETRQTLSAARETMVAFQRVSQKAENNLDNIESFTEPLKERGGRLIDNFERSTQNLNELLQQLVTFSESLNNGQGTLGKLVHDDELYQRIQRIVANVEDSASELRPIVDDVRIFTDKIARDPRRTGRARGARPPPQRVENGRALEQSGVTPGPPTSNHGVIKGRL